MFRRAAILRDALAVRASRHGPNQRVAKAMNKAVSIQERGLILLIGLAVVASGLLVFTDLPESVQAPSHEAIRLEEVVVLIPRFVESGPMDINRANLDDLITLPGIGPALAQRIIDYRSEHGPFQSIEELERVSGIGSLTIQGFIDAVVAEP